MKGRDLEGELAERFTDAVERQMMSDVPYGAFLSGGVDSAAIVAAMARRSERPPMTFTIGFPGHGDVLDERRYARETAATLGTDHHETAMAEGDFLGELERCVRRLEEPVGLPSAGALMQLSRFAAESVKVVLSGQGADEPHGGYGRHQAAAALGAAGIAGRAAGPAGLAGRARGRGQRAGAPREPAAGRPGAGRPPGAAAGDHRRRPAHRADRRPAARRPPPSGAPAPTPSWPTWATAAWWSRRCTWTPTCTCRTAS